LPNINTENGEAATRSSNLDRHNYLLMFAMDALYPNSAMSINWRASLVPAAAVIPAPKAYTTIVAVKKLVVVGRKLQKLNYCWEKRERESWLVG